MPELQDIDMQVVNRKLNPLPNRPKYGPDCARRDGAEDSSPCFTGRDIPDFVYTGSFWGSSRGFDAATSHRTT